MFRKCVHCNAFVEVLEDCNCSCGLECCGEKMTEVRANSTEAAFEKHIPNYEIKEDKIIVRVNHVMEEEHYIEWIEMRTPEYMMRKYLKAGEEAVVEFPYLGEATLYSYCNKHGLWTEKV